jgi:nuclear pore complex protein Nup98-Nup96
VHVLTRRLQAYLDYAHAMTRLPELHASISDAAVPDAVEETEFETFVRAIPRLMSILPDVLYSKSDPRHKVALAEMMSGLTAVLDEVKPLALVRPSSSALYFFLMIDFGVVCGCRHNHRSG